MNIKRYILFILISICYLSGIIAKVTLPPILSSNMVLQQNENVVLWGKASPKAELSILASWTKSPVFTETGDDGSWQIKIQTPSVGGPYNIVFDDGERTVLENIYMGDVWVCSGQSNMEMPVKGFYSQPVLGSTEVIAEAVPGIPIRMFSVVKSYSKQKRSEVRGHWVENTISGVKDFSATAYFFGKQLYRSLNVPIGLINTSWGGFNIEAWMPEDSLKLFPEVSLEHLYSDKKIKFIPHAASMLHNAMLYPLHRLKVKGFIWYQGEANRKSPQLYESQMMVFVNYLRDLFGKPDLLFYYVQIAPFSYGKEEGMECAELREAQFNLEDKISDSGMVVLMDLGEKTCIHPSRKKEVGQRLAYLALNKTYGYDGLPAFSPRYVSKEVKGNSIFLNFDNVGLGLTSFGKELENFEIAGEDSVFVKAKAIVQGNRVKVWSDNIKKTIAVRYGFKNYVAGDLFGVNGLPVSSFRTDF